MAIPEGFSHDRSVGETHPESLKPIEEVELVIVGGRCTTPNFDTY
jgi:hypothetical protein